MLSGPCFSSAFVFSINSLILSGFPLTSFHLAEASICFLFVFFSGFILLCVQLSKNIRKCLLFIIIHIFQYSFCNQPVFFAQLENIKKPWSEITTKIKPSHVAFKLTMCSIVGCSSHKMQWYHEGMASLSDVRVKRKISCQQYINIWLNMMSSHWRKPNFL